MGQMGGCFLFVRLWRSTFEKEFGFKASKLSCKILHFVFKYGFLSQFFRCLFNLLGLSLSYQASINSFVPFLFPLSSYQLCKATISFNKSCNVTANNSLVLPLPLSPHRYFSAFTLIWSANSFTHVTCGKCLDGNSPTSIPAPNPSTTFCQNLPAAVIAPMVQVTGRRVSSSLLKPPSTFCR